MSKGGSPTAALDCDLPAPIRSLGLVDTLQPACAAERIPKIRAVPPPSGRQTTERACSTNVARIALTSGLGLLGLVDACPGLCFGLLTLGSISNRLWMTTRGPGSHALEPPPVQFTGTG